MRLNPAFTPEGRTVRLIRELCQAIDSEVLRFESLPDSDPLAVIAQKAATLLEDAERILQA